MFGDIDTYNGNGPLPLELASPRGSIDMLTTFTQDSFNQDDGIRAALPLTIKKRATAAEIQADLRERIERQVARDEKFRGCEAPLPRPSRVRNDGPNWTVDGFPGLQSGCFGTLVKIVDQARLEYELVS
jgi:hypothetical protein